jgi:hypothetical protein
VAYREIENVKLVGQFDRKLRGALNRNGLLSEERTIGYPSGYTTRQVNFLSKEDKSIWHCSWVGKNEQIINLFGRGEYGSTKTLNIDLQFNYALDRVDRQLGGAFLEDTETGEISLAHRGIVTVRSRIKKELVFEGMAPYAVEANSGKKLVDFLLVTDLYSKSLARDIGEFAAELRDSVQEKNQRPESKAQSTVKKGSAKKTGFDQLKDYFKEFTGQRKSFKPKRVYAKANHGKVVDALHREFLGNGTPYKSREIDLAVEQSKRTLLFEVKTSSDPQSLYTAIGQLSIHTSPTSQCTNKPVLQVLVVPEQPMHHVSDVIESTLGFKVVVYSINSNGQVRFENLSAI